jgi:hypothetical protein
MTQLDALLRALSEGGVEFIVIGGIAATIHGSTRSTRHLDVVYSRSPANLSRLVTALRPYEPYLRGAPPNLPFRWDEQTIAAGLNFTLTTTLGEFDILGELSGGGTYEQLVAHSLETTAFGVTVRTLSLPMLIHVKRAAGRPKDFEAIAELEVLLELIEKKDAG